MHKIHPCLWFDVQAQDAAKFYASLFKNSKVSKGSPMSVEFELEGLSIVGLNGGPHFQFSPAVSFFVECESEEAIDGLWAKLNSAKEVIWELKEYPWSKKYGWCVDKFGVSWQVMLTGKERKIAPAFLFVDKLFGKGEQAINFYMSVFKNSKIETMHKDPTGKFIMHSTFTLEGQEFVLMEGDSPHKHTITPAISFIVDCHTQEEVDGYWDSICKGGGAPGQCGWCVDKFGVSWQIIPVGLGKMLNDSNKEKANQVMKAMMKMKKLDIASLEKAYSSN